MFYNLSLMSLNELYNCSLSIFYPKSYLLVVVGDCQLAAAGASVRAGGFVHATAEAAGPRLARASDRIPELECEPQYFIR